MDIIQPNPAVTTQNSQIQQTPQIENTHHSVLPIILIIMGILETIFISLYFKNLIIIKLTRLYQEIITKQPQDSYIGMVVLTIFVILAIAQTIYGFKLKKLNKQLGNLPSRHRRIAIGILIFVLLVVFLTIAAFLYSYMLLYTLIQSY